MAQIKRTRNKPLLSATEPPSLRSRLDEVDWSKALNDGLIYLLAVGGFYLGFSTLYGLALHVGYTTPEAAVAASLADMAVFAYSRKALQEVKAGRSAWGIRLIVSVFSVATFALQLRSAWPDPTSLAFHAMPPAVWVIGHEMMLRGNLRDARKALRAKEIATGMRPAPLPRIRRVHWLLSPKNTFKVWRRMKLWELPQHVVVRQLADDLIAKNQEVPAAWQGILLTPVALPAGQEAPKTLEIEPPEDEPEPRTEEDEMYERFLQALPSVPPEGPNGRAKEAVLAWCDRVEQLAGEFGVECTSKLLAGILNVDPSRISRIRPKKELAAVSD
ncbi:DUF2637 domain-containing protein [Streptomyces mirabilis]|uniref:DUF2637 domain-containing protein n=1 Tax=Streptomyces mirabilis TaxID=68239 RepID=UPI003688601C